MESVKSFLSRHNNLLSRANNKNNQTIFTCNCLDKDSSLLNGKCLQEIVVYKATITTQNESKECIRSTEGTFKKRWYTNISDIKNEKVKEQNFPSIFLKTNSQS